MDQAWISYRQEPRRHGLLASLMYLSFAVMLVVSATLLDGLGDRDVVLGVTLNSFTENQWHLPANFKIQSGGLLSDPYPTDITQRGTGEATWMSCVDSTMANCTDVMEQRFNSIFIAIGKNFAKVNAFSALYPELQDFSKIKFQYMTNVDSYNYPVVKYYAEGAKDSIVCNIRRARYTVGGTSTNELNPPNSFAFCSLAWNDPDFRCENEVEPHVPTHVFVMDNGVVRYLGKALRRELYLNAGNHAFLSGSPSGQGIISPVVATTEYQGGYVRAMAPWDIVSAMNCKSYDPKTGRGWLWKGQGRVTMQWKPGPAIVLNSFALLSIMIFMTCIQTKYLRSSGFAVAPIYLSKTFIGIVILVLGYYGNYNNQILALFLTNGAGGTKNIDLTLYKALGPFSLASINGIMLCVLSQAAFNPRVVSPSKALTMIAMVGWITTFTLEFWILPQYGETTKGKCVGTGGTACVKFSKAIRNYVISIIVPLVVLALSVAFIYLYNIRCMRKHKMRPLSNSVINLFGFHDAKDLVTNVPSACDIVQDIEGEPKLYIDPGVLLQKNLVRITNKRIVRFTSMKYALLFQLFPGFRRKLSELVGSTLCFKCENNRVDLNFHYEELDAIDLDDTQECSYFLS